MDLKDRIAIVTGGSRGIGKKIVEVFCNRGAKVYFTYNSNHDEAEKTVQSSGAVAIQCNQNDHEGINRVVDSIFDKEKRINILVNNAGITDDQFFAIANIGEWYKVLEVNMNGTIYWSKSVCKPMIHGGYGTIINVASVSGLVGIPGQTNYSTSKGAILAFTRSLAAELASKKIRVNSVVPGFIDTDMTGKMPRDIKKQNLGKIALKRFGTAEEVAKVTAFLASEDSSYITGQAIVVDGGLTATAVF
ncbi:MAG: 3-oxoacyl-ACP reductase FabG [Fibrobacter sp.]|nr:3-oxoacyl-ACP reductase FabG [Fibrobacter sp.]